MASERSKRRDLLTFIFITKKQNKKTKPIYVFIEFVDIRGKKRKREGKKTRKQSNVKERSTSFNVKESD